MLLPRLKKPLCTAKSLVLVIFLLRSCSFIQRLRFHLPFTNTIEPSCVAFTLVKNQRNFDLHPYFLE